MRERFLNESVENFAPHEALEILLFYAIPRGNTNKIAHDLIHRFGSLSAVFDAKIEDLCEVQGVGERSAILRELVLNSAELVAKYASKHFKGCAEERLYLMCLDSVCNLLCFREISNGNMKRTPVDLGLIAKIAFENNACVVICTINKA